MLPDSIGCLSRLELLHLGGCWNLQKLPSSFGRLTALRELYLLDCSKLETLPDSITALSGLQWLGLWGCSSISNLPTTLGRLTGLTSWLSMDLATEGQAVALAQLNAPFPMLMVRKCNDEAISVLDGLGGLGNLNHLSCFGFIECSSMTKLPKAIGLLMNLIWLELFECERLRKLPNCIGQLKLLRKLIVKKCRGVETLPSSLGALTQLRVLWIVECVSLTKLPTSLGHLSRLRQLCIEGCSALRYLPECVRQLDALKILTVDCGNLEAMGVVRALRGLRIWGCTSIMELPGSSLMVVDSNFWDPAWYQDLGYLNAVRGELKELQVVEANDCGLLRLVQERDRGRVMWQRVHKLSRCTLSMV